MGLDEYPPRPLMRSLALGLLALVVLFNGYSDIFGDHWGNVWRTVNPLFIGSSSVAAVALWRSGHPAARFGAVLSAALGALVLPTRTSSTTGLSGRFSTRHGCLQPWPGPPAPAKQTWPFTIAVSHRPMDSIPLLPVA